MCRATLYESNDTKRSRKFGLSQWTLAKLVWNTFCIGGVVNGVTSDRYLKSKVESKRAVNDDYSGRESLGMSFWG